MYLFRLCVPTAFVSGRSQLRSADDNQLLVPRTQTVTLVPERSPHPDLMLGTLCPLSCIIHLCLWTVLNVHSRLFCSVHRLGFLVITGTLCDDCH